MYALQDIYHGRLIELNIELLSQSLGSFILTHRPKKTPTPPHVDPRAVAWKAFVDPERHLIVYWLVIAGNNNQTRVPQLFYSDTVPPETCNVPEPLLHELEKFCRAAQLMPA